MTESGTFLFAFFKCGTTVFLAMQCEYCDNEATVFFTQIIDGVSKDTAFCEECAKQHGVTDPGEALLGNMEPIYEAGAKEMQPHLPIGDEQTAPILTSPQVSAGNVICSECGFSFNDLKKTGRLGCSKCYQFFRNEIKQNLASLHKGTHHTGRVPEGMHEVFKQRQLVEELQVKLDEAIRDEDFEKAAALLDDIKKNSDDPTLKSES